MSSLRDLVGVELEPTGWLEVTQARIDEFAHATGDMQWIHTDPVRAAEGPFGTTVAHGYLTLSLCAPLLSEALAGLTGYGMSINYGTNRVRFPAPVPAGSRIRARVSSAFPSAVRPARWTRSPTWPGSRWDTPRSCVAVARS